MKCFTTEKSFDGRVEIAENLQRQNDLQSYSKHYTNLL